MKNSYEEQLARTVSERLRSSTISSSPYDPPLQTSPTATTTTRPGLPTATDGNGNGWGGAPIVKDSTTTGHDAWVKEDPFAVVVNADPVIAAAKDPTGEFHDDGGGGGLSGIASNGCGGDDGGGGENGQ